jgi:hypothetical protein
LMVAVNTPVISLVISMVIKKDEFKYSVFI